MEMFEQAPVIQMQIEFGVGLSANPFLGFALELKQGLRVAGRSAAGPDPRITA